MFDKPKHKTPPGSEVVYEVRYRGGRKPFPTEREAITFADDVRKQPDGWAEVARLIRTVIQKRR
jgi:hypothetical protein